MSVVGGKLDLSRLTDNEAEHVLQVVQRDMRLRKKEEERLSELKQELDDEGSRCLLLLQQSCFNQRCCIRCCNSFTFLLNPRRQCRDCGYYVCKACRVYCKRDKAWLCCACQKSRLLKTQSLEWFYNKVKKRFKRFGSAKVLKTLYRKHLAEHSALSELTDGSTYEESVYNEDSVCGSDSTFYRQSEEHSMEEMFSVALRVAEEAINEAISKADFEVSTLEKQNEAQYLREHRAELIEEVAKTIVHKIINRRKTLAEMKTDYDQDWIHERRQSACVQASGLKHQTDCVRSHSAFSLLDAEPSHQASKKEGVGSAMSPWKSLERLDNPSASSVLMSPDGNWIALQNTLLSRPGLLTKRKSLVYSALEVESGVVSPYEGMGSDNENKAEPDGLWGAVQRDIQRRRTDANFNPQDTEDTHSHQTRILSPLTGHVGDRGDLLPDPEENWYHNTAQEALLRTNVGLDIRPTSSSRRTSIIDVNFNPKGSAEENSVAAEKEVEIVERSWKKRRNKNDPTSSPLNYNKKDHQSIPSSDAVTPDMSAPEPSEVESDTSGWGASPKIQNFKQPQLARHASTSECSTPEEGDGVSDHGWDRGQREESRQGSEDRDERDERLCEMEQEKEKMEENETDDEEMECRLYRLVEQSRLAYFSSTDDELDNVRRSDGEQTSDEDREEDRRTEALSYKICRLEKPAGDNRFSSTEDELHRSGNAEGKRKTGEDEERRDEELTAKVCRLANEIRAAQFSSTEDELDKVGCDEEALWKLQGEKRVQATQVLASLVSASQFSSTEDELDQVEDEEAWMAETEKDERCGDGGDAEVETFGKVKSLQRKEENQELEFREMSEEKIQKDNQPEMKRTDRLDEDDEEMDRIISSMLMMTTLEGVQMETVKEEPRKPDLEKDGLTRDKTGFSESGLDGRCSNELETQEFHRQSNTLMSNTREGEKVCSEVPGKTGKSTKEKNKSTSEDMDEAKVCFRRAEASDDRKREERDGADDERKETDQILEESRSKHAEAMEQRAPNPHRDFQSSEEIQSRYSAESLRSITTEVLKVLNAAEDMLQGVETGDKARLSTTSVPPNTDPRKLDQQFSRLEENVYVTAGTVYSLETELSDLEECARAICSNTSNMELSFLEERVASAAAKVQQSELQICDISARITALKSAGLNVDPRSRLTKGRIIPPVTLDSSRQLRRRLPAPPVDENKKN